MLRWKRILGVLFYVPWIILFGGWCGSSLLAVGHWWSLRQWTDVGLTVLLVFGLGAAAVTFFNGARHAWRSTDWSLQTKGTGVLTLIALGVFIVTLPKLKRRIDRSEENLTLSHLAALRQSVYDYRTAHRKMPKVLPVSTRSPLLDLRLPQTPHPLGREVRYRTLLSIEDSGEWLYLNQPGYPEFGTVLIDCTHLDSVGNPWSSY